VTESVTPTRGTFTFLFTDIEGSTNLEVRVGRDRYGELRERHRAILRQVWSAHEGREQGTEGDSFFVVFDEAANAVEAAVDAQRALVKEAWPDDAPIRVRMGLNSGAAETTGRSLVGLSINRAARIAALAHGGQILASGLTRDLLEDQALDDVRLRDLGEHRLKDIGAPVRILQVIADGLPAEFPALRSLEARPNNLPTQLTTFVGRERELAEAGALLARTRLLTFTGPGGTGKTRLSIQVATAAADAFPDGTWFVALEAVRDPALVAPTIIRALGVADSTTRSAIDGVVDTIGERRMLLLLDNFEQVVAAGPVVAEILRRCPNVTCLVTTRVALHVSGEQEYPVPGLPAPPDPSRLSEVDRLNLPRALREFDLDALNEFEAVRLFIARATAVKPGFSVTSANAPAVAAIVGRLHGMPLAIELAAARVKLLKPEQILARLDHHLATLTSGSRDLPERQQTLRGAIAWSYDLLDDGARELLDRLSVFRGGFELDMAEPVCGPADEIGGDVVDRIGELVDQSLVRIDEEREEPRFTMLETIREYAAEMLASHGEADEIGRRHAETFLGFAQRAAPELSGPAQRRWLDRLEREHDNLRAALDWATDHPEPALAARLAFALWRFWQKRGYLNEARARLEAMASLGWDLDPVDRAIFAETLGGVAYWQSDRPAAAMWYDEALVIWRRSGDRAQIANALYNRAYADMIEIMGGDATADTFATVGKMMEEALDIYRQLGDMGGQGNLLWGLGSFHYFTADAATAETWYRRSLDLHRAAGDRTMEAWSLHMLTLSAAGQRHWDEARETGRDALRHFYEAGDVAGVTLVVDDLAIIALADGDRVRSARLWGAARHLQQTTGTALADDVRPTRELFGVPSPQDVMTDDELAANAAEGAAMGLDELVAYALEIEDGVVPASHSETTR
jgi:predicted ATPase/class 3 adenylate cyclase